MRRCLPLLLAAACSSPATPKARDYGDAWQDARRHFREANVILHDGLLAFETDDLATLIDAENHLDDDCSAKLAAAAARGLEEARAAVAANPGGVEGHLYLCLNLGLLTLTKSRVTAMFSGAPTDIRKEYERAIEIDGTFASGGAYRFKGRFLAAAPWPVGDKKAAEEALLEANRIAPVRQNNLFLGDLYWAQKRSQEAAEAWRRAANGPTSPATAIIDDQVAELARRRLALR